MLTLQFIPYTEIENLTPESRISKLLNIVKEEKIVLMEGRLSPGEETRLIEKTMEQINRYFKGIEICTVYPEKKNIQFFEKLKKEILKIMLGNRTGFTIIGPATIIKEIKRNPTKIELLTKERRKKNKK